MALPFSLQMLFSGESSMKRVLSGENNVDQLGFENNLSAKTFKKISLELFKLVKNFPREVSILEHPSCPRISKGGLTLVKKKLVMSSTVDFFIELQMTTRSVM